MASGIKGRVSNGATQRARNAAQWGAIGGMAIAVVLLPATDASAACRRPSGAGANVFDFIPLASGSTVSSIIATVGAINTSSLAQSTAFVGVPPNPKPDQQGGGDWSRVVVGEVETKANTVVTGTAGPLVNATDECRSTTQLDFKGSQAGMDISRLNFNGGGHIHIGVTAGYFDVTSKDKTAELGQFKSEAQVPFAGLYLALQSGNLSFDAQLRGDYYQMSLSDVDNGMFNQDVTARGLAFLWNAAYRFDLPNQWFLETSMGGVSSRTEVDHFGVAGGINVPIALTPSLTFPGSVQIDHVDSLLGRASVRVGTTIISGNIALQPFATASVFHEFAGAVRTNISTLVVGLPLQATTLTERVGTYGHLGLGLAGTILDTGWLGYARLDYRFGEDLEGLSFNAGLRYQFMPAANVASLKDDHGKAAAHYEGYDWTGLYAGWHSGALWGIQDWTYDINGARTNPKYQGYVGGAQLGYNHQFGHTVIGVEVDYAFSNAQGGKSCPNANFFTCVAEVENLAFVTGRLGYARDRALYYVRGGLAIGDVTVRTRQNLGSVVPPDVSAGTSSTQTGWAFGAGMEFAVSDRWSVKGEWMHYDLGSDRYTVDSGLIVKADTSGDVARIGVNYHFGK